VEDFARLLFVESTADRYEKAPINKKRPASRSPFALLQNRCLVFDDFLDSTHGALFQAVAASDASFLVHYRAYAVNNLDAGLRAGIDADAAADAFIGNNNGMRHDRPLLYSGLFEMLCTRGNPSTG
jgi:hypothetical protein